MTFTAGGLSCAPPGSIARVALRLVEPDAIQFACSLLLAQSGGIFEATALARPIEASRQTVMDYLAVPGATFVMNVVRPYAAAGAAEIASAPPYAALT